MSENTRKAALSGGALLVIIAAAVAVTLLRSRCSSGGVECQPSRASVECRVSLMTTSDKPIRICWDMMVDCSNGSRFSVPRCTVMRRSAPERTLTIHVATTPSATPCDAARSVTVSNVTEKPLTL